MRRLIDRIRDKWAARNVPEFHSREDYLAWKEEQTGQQVAQDEGTPWPDRSAAKSPQPPRARAVDGNPICPYCAHRFERFPARKRKCPACENTIIIWRGETSRETSRTLVTEARAEALERERQEEKASAKEERRERGSRNRWIRKLESDGVTREDFERQRKRSASDADAIWALFNQVTQSYMKCGDYQGLSAVYYDMALFLDEEGKDSLKVGQAARKMTLMDFKETGVVDAVEIVGGGGCSKCQALAGRRLSIDEALRTMPIPCAACEDYLNYPNRGLCRCIYVAAVD